MQPVGGLISVISFCIALSSTHYFRFESYKGDKMKQHGKIEPENYETSDSIVAELGQGRV